MIELLLVMLIIAIMSTILIGISTYVSTMNEKAQTEAARQKIISALEEYRALYGEYPIQSNSRHYATSFVTDDTGNCPWSNMNLAANVIETLRAVSSGWGGTVRVDYSLVYPLMLGQLEKGREPLISFPRVHVMDLAYRFDSAKDLIARRLVDGRVNIRANPIYRYVAEDPVSKLQFKYTCTDGRSYTLDYHSRTAAVPITIYR